MTPAEHIATAEQLADQADDAYGSGLLDEAASKAARGLLHGVIAIAVELGVPHAAAPGGAHDAG